MAPDGRTPKACVHQGSGSEVANQVLSHAHWPITAAGRGGARRSNSRIAELIEHISLAPGPDVGAQGAWSKTPAAHRVRIWQNSSAERLPRCTRATRLVSPRTELTRARDENAIADCIVETLMAHWVGKEKTGCWPNGGETGLAQMGEAGKKPGGWWSVSALRRGSAVVTRCCNAGAGRGRTVIKAR